MVVRFITKRFIGEYDPNLEKVYTFHTVVDTGLVQFEILDAAGQPNVSKCCSLRNGSVVALCLVIFLGS